MTDPDRRLKLPDEVRAILRDEARFSGAVFPDDPTTTHAGKDAAVPEPGLSDKDRPAKGWFRLGFAFSLLVACCLAAAYRHRIVIADHVPDVAPSLVALAEQVVAARRLAEVHFAWIPELTSRVATILSGSSI
ncbi:MAG: hypothetical protein OXI81_19305 [Paracoccaceae bacterium]|nr:hypothetical protein [Paracoccaceae bacterium]MDE2912933.1 hypothetical protein [Paracoccaceae bacterium]